MTPDPRTEEDASMPDYLDIAANALMDRVALSIARGLTEQRVRQVLADVYTPDGVETWMDHANTAFDGRSALEAIADGDGALVLRRAQYIAGGAW